MNYQAMVAKTLVKAMPAVVVRKLLDDEHFSAFADLSLLSYGDVGSIRHAEMLSALQRAKDGNGEAELTARNGKRIIVKRRPEVCGVALVEDGRADRAIWEFGFLDPDREVRLATLRHAAAQCWPKMPRVESWHAALSERALRESELSHLLSEFRDTPSQFLAALERKWRSGAQMGVDEFIPTSLAYFSTVVGPPCEIAAQQDWIEDVVAPDLHEAIRLSLRDGLKRALALNVDSRLSPVRFARDLPEWDLLSALKDLAESRSPIALLGVLEIAVANFAVNQGFTEVAADALEHLFGGKAGKNGIACAWKLMPALVRATLGRISVSNELSALPLSWRRLAACAHAHILVELLEVDGENVDRFVDWLGGVETEMDVAASLLDMMEEPLWRAWDLSPGLLRASIVGRVMAIKPLLDERGLGGIVDSALNALQAEDSLLDAERPGPLCQGGARMADLVQRKGTDSEWVSEHFAKAGAEICEDPIGETWKGMSVACRLLRFDSPLLEGLSKAIGRATIREGDDGRRRFLEALLLAGDVAATQPCESLADAVGIALVRDASRLTELVDVVTGYRILVVASGAFRDKAKAIEWMGSRMADYAFAIPKGPPCRRLFADLVALDALLSFDSKCLGRAKKFASAGFS
jgi:hypothetical protein